MGAVCPRRVPSAPFVDVGVGELSHLFAHQLPIGARMHGVHLQQREEEREEREERGEVRSEVSSQNPACSSAAAVRAAAAAHHKTLLRDVLSA